MFWKVLKSDEKIWNRVLGEIKSFEGVMTKVMKSYDNHNFSEHFSNFVQMMYPINTSE